MPRTPSRRRCCAPGGGCRGSRAGARFRSWLHRIATNVCLKQIERRPKRVLPVDYGPPRDPHGVPEGPLVEYNFPALPIRQGAEVFVWLSRFDDEAAHARHVEKLERSPTWRDGLSQALAERIERRPEVLRLAPTARSLLRG